MKKGTVFLVTGLLLVTAALFLTGYHLLDNHRAGIAADAALEQLARQIYDDPTPAQGRIPAESDGAKENDSDAEAEYPDYVLNPEMPMPIERLNESGYIGILSIPSIDRELPVMSEWNYTNLKTAPCRYAGSAYLDNMVICAHNYGIHFGSLKNLSYGDGIIFTDTDGNVFRYEVTEIEILQPTAAEEMTTGDWDLTLFTCTLGGASRITVRCEKKEEARF